MKRRAHRAPVRRFLFHLKRGLRIIGYLTVTAVSGAALTVFAVLAAPVVIWKVLGRRRPRLSKAEQRARRTLGVPPAHPERVTGRVSARTRRELHHREMELRAAGIEAWAIVDEHRRRL